jgi:hypothetical protein
MKEKLTSLVERLLVLPNEVADLQIKALAINDTIQLLSESIISRESEIKSEINAAIDENGKKLYSNDDARKLAFLVDSKDDTTLFHLYASKKEISHQLDVVKISIETHSNEQRNIRAILLVVNLVAES